MSFLRTKPAEIRAPETLVLPDSRKRLTRFYQVAQVGVLPPDLDLPWGTLDDGPAPDGWTGLRLTNRQLSDDVPMPGKDSRPILELIYEQIPESDEVQVGNLAVTIDQSNISTVVIEYLQFSTGTAVLHPPGTIFAPAPHEDCVIKQDDRTDDGTLRHIKRTFINGGLIASETQEKNNGALSIQTDTYINEVPPTPSGYILIASKSESPNGVPINTYTFAKGEGQIGYDAEYRLSNDNGATGLVVVTIRYISGSSIDSNPITGPEGYALVQINKEDQDGYRVWTGIYADGSGEIIFSTDEKYNGKLIIYSKTSINAAPTVPAATIGGTVVEISHSNRHDRFHEGVILYEASWAEGEGLIASSIRMRTDGLREQTYISLGTKQTPAAGIIILDENEEIDGVTKYTVTAMQSADGSDPATATFNVDRHVPFTYPGRAKAYSATASNGWTIIDVYRSPPIETLVLGNVAISYQTSGSLGTISDFWQPTIWATIEAEWIGLNNLPKLHIEALRGYRSVSGTPVGVTTSIWAGDAGGTMLGEVVFGGTTAVVTVSGGPEDPGGNTYTLEAAVEPAFTAIDGTVFYRKTIITATIPAQEALPV